MDSRTYKRMFSNGIVVVRFRNSDGDNYSDSATYQLGGSYRPVNADGSLGTAVTSVTFAQRTRILSGSRHNNDRLISKQLARPKKPGDFLAFHVLIFIF